MRGRLRRARFGIARNGISRKHRLELVRERFRMSEMSHFVGGAVVDLERRASVTAAGETKSFVKTCGRLEGSGTDSALELACARVPVK